MSLDLARAVADAVLYEGYLLYPYRASSAKNRVRWQFGVLGPPGAAEAGLGEESSMRMQCLLTRDPHAVAGPSLVVHLRFLQLQHRQVYDARGAAVEHAAVGDVMPSWDEAVEREVTLPLELPEPGVPSVVPVAVDDGEEREELAGGGDRVAGAVVRRRWPLAARVTATTTEHEGFTRLEVVVDNVGPAATDKDDAIRRSLIGAHLIVEGHGLSFVSLLEPPAEALEAVATCTQQRCWPVLAGAPRDTGLVLGSPIILYDYPEIAAESAGALFDATEIDEILTLRVMTMTEQEKAEARATDARAREIIDRCDQVTPEALQQLHGVLRNPHAGSAPGSAGTWPGAWPASDVRNREPPTFDTGEVPWWDPEADAAVRPEVDSVNVDGVAVARGSLVRVQPSRRADAQDLFFAGQVARVSAVLSDVDGEVHVALVLADDPGADLHDWYGRYWYFAPDEVVPLSPDEVRAFEASTHDAQREESSP